MIIKTIFLLSVVHYSLGFYNFSGSNTTKPKTNFIEDDADPDQVREGFPGYRYYPVINSWLKLHTEAADWQTARMYCHDEDAVLAAPLSEQIYAALTNVVSRQSNETFGDIYVAVQVNYPEGIYEYRNGAPVLTLKPNLPDMTKCGVYRAGASSLTWSNCLDRLPYACQAPAVSACRDKGQRSQNICQTPVSACDKDYELDTRTGKCYKFHTQCLPWNDAHRTCLEDGAHLAIANSDEEAEVLKQIFAKYPFEVLNGTHPLWGVMAVGFYYWKDADKYVTIYGETIEEAGYAKWSSGNPSSRGKSKELGGGMFRSGLLDDVDKSYKVPFICEKKPLRLQPALSLVSNQ